MENYAGVQIVDGEVAYIVLCFVLYAALVAFGCIYLYKVAREIRSILQISAIELLLSL